MKKLASIILTASVLFTAGCSKSTTNPEPAPEPSDFAIEQTGLTQGSFNVKITPKDNGQTYYFGLLEKSYYSSQFDSKAENLTSFNTSYFDQLASAQGVSLEEFLKEGLLKGVREQAYKALTPETDYVFYVYGVNFEGKATTEVVFYDFKTPKPEFYSDFKFSIVPSDITSVSFKVKIASDNPDIFYYYDVIPNYTYEQYCNNDPAQLPSYVNTYFEALRSENDKFKAMTLPQFISTISVNGEVEYDTASDASLLPETSYFVFAIGVANDGSFTTPATVLEVKTAETPKNTWTFVSENISDISYKAVINASESEAFAVLMERQYYFPEGTTDEEMVNDLLAANGNSFSAFSHADNAAPEFTGLIPDEDYYVFLIAINTDGTPKTGSKLNVVKHAVKTLEATMTGAVYSINVYDIQKTTAKANISGNDAASGQTYITNFISKSDLAALQSSGLDEDAALKKHCDEFIDSKLEEWNKSHTTPMDRKEFLSRALISDLGTGTYSAYEGLSAGTEYYAYAIGMKADGTYTTAPFKTAFTTVADAKSQVTANILMQAGYFEDVYPNKTQYTILYTGNPSANTGDIYVKFFLGSDDWAGKTAAEVKELLLKETPSTRSYMSSKWISWDMEFFTYGIIYDFAGVPTDVYKTSHTSKKEGGNYAIGQTITIEKVEVLK